MKIKVIKIIEKEIESCYHECPHFDTYGGPSPVMRCDHPEIQKECKEKDDPYLDNIISHPECNKGFPKKCPLLKDKKV